MRAGWGAAGPWPWVVMAGVLAGTAAILRWEGRVWWCSCGQAWPWISDVWTRHCSQHLIDPYSLTHVSHGMIFCGALWPLRRWVGVGWRLSVAVMLAAGWEILENSAFIINRYREATMSLDYLGDSVANSLGDILSCAAGFYVARRLGLWRTVALFVVIEVALLFLIRDNLTLNVVMLVHPVEAIKAWQTAGHPGG